MSLGKVTYTPIGIVHSRHRIAEKTPIQPAYASDYSRYDWKSIPEYVEGLRDLDGFSYVYLIYHLHRAAPSRLTVRVNFSSRMWTGEYFRPSTLCDPTRSD